MYEELKRRRDEAVSYIGRSKLLNETRSKIDEDKFVENVSVTSKDLKLSNKQVSFRHW